jgi:hypothetical protein
MQRIIIDGDNGADRILRNRLGDLEIAAVLADADAIVAQLLAGDGIFVDDVGEVALLGAVAVFPVAVDHPGLAHFGLRDHHLARRRRPFPGGADLQRLVGGGAKQQPERGKQHQIDEPGQIRHEAFPSGGAGIRRTIAAGGSNALDQRALVSASQIPPPIMKPPEIRDNNRVRCAEKNSRARPANIA